jgi:hypothetical protein
MTPQREYELASELLGVQSEQELDRFLPLLALAAPLIGQIAGPLLKNVAGSLFGGGGASKRRAQNEQEYFLGNIVKGLFGETEAESYEQEQFLGGILKGILGGEMESAYGEQENFLLGGLLGKLFKGEMEGESYEQEQFLGGILKGILGGEIAGEVGPAGHDRMMHRARRFVRLVHMAARHAAAEIAAMQRAGRQADEMQMRLIVLRAIVNATRQLKPRLAAAAFPGGPSSSAFGAFGGQQPGPPQGGAQSEEMSGHATWVREGNRLTFTL